MTARLLATLRDPLCQFVLIGGILFGLDAWLHPAPPSLIQVPAGLDEPLQQQYIDGQILLREALKHGLDQGDSIIERQLQQKMRALLESQASRTEPQEADLQAWLAAHPQRYAGPQRIDLEQLYWPRSALKSNAPEEDLHALQSGAEPSQPISTLLRVSHAELRRRYGKTLANAAFEVGPQWSGPFTSGLGTHLLRVVQRHPPPPADFADLREQLAQDWREAQREQGYAQAMQALRSQYQIAPGQP